jgi:hypothetical protein
MFFIRYFQGFWIYQPLNLFLSFRLSQSVESQKQFLSATADFIESFACSY